jgi:hypothetical protein
LFSAYFICTTTSPAISEFFCTGKKFEIRQANGQISMASWKVDNTIGRRCDLLFTPPPYTTICFASEQRHSFATVVLRDTLRSVREG